MADYPYTQLGVWFDRINGEGARLQHKLQETGDEFILHMQGKFTHRDYADFLAVVDRMVEARTQHFIFDMDHLDFIDSAGIGMMLMILDIGQRHAVEVIVRNTHGPVQAVIRNAHLDELFALV
jgi:stage II sporulation protein AA (anti-sigma F factor antagonist)